MKRFITGGAVIAFKDKNVTGVAISKALNYGSLQKYNKNQLYIHNKTILACSGEYSDVQEMLAFLKEEEAQENAKFEPVSYFKMIQRYLYTARSDLTPLNIHCVIAGFNFLGSVDHLGNFYETDAICTQLGHHIVLPYLRESSDEPRVKLMTGMELLYKRDCKASKEVQFGIITEEGIEIIDETVLIDWEIGRNTDETLYL